MGSLRIGLILALSLVLCADEWSLRDVRMLACTVLVIRVSKSKFTAKIHHLPEHLQTHLSEHCVHSHRTGKASGTYGCMVNILGHIWVCDCMLNILGHIWVCDSWVCANRRTGRMRKAESTDRPSGNR